MAHFKLFTSCLAALVLQSAAWAEIYETKDVDGNTIFTDSPIDTNSEVVNLPQTNTANAVSSRPQDEQKSDPGAINQPNLTTGNPVVIHDANTETNEEHLERLKDYERRHSATPYEVGDSDSQMPHEVGDSDSQKPHEVGDSDSQMPHEVGDSDSQMPHEVGDSDSQMPHEVGDSDSQMPH